MPWLYVAAAINHVLLDSNDGDEGKSHDNNNSTIIACTVTITISDRVRRRGGGGGGGRELPLKQWLSARGSNDSN